MQYIKMYCTMQYINLNCTMQYIYKYTFLFSVCLSVRLCPINVITTEPFGPNFCVGPRMTPRKVYGCSELGVKSFRII